MNTRTKVLCYAALLAAWGFFAYAGKTPVDGFITAIGAALATLGAVHVAAGKPQVDQPPTTPQ
ncbi:hypothetical protein [Pandoraea sputorum]|uniref:hypothetical protein n=1 Tax=Pandoraea sputorum TaxID=93222 RepID=UPI002F3EECE8